MRSPLFTYFLFSILIGTASLTVKQAPCKGVWKIDSVTVGSDTLFLSDSIEYTIDFYNQQMTGWDKTEADVNYISKCMRSTYTDLNKVRLIIKRKTYNQTPIMPCWDNLKFNGINDGNYSFTNDTLKLLENKMDLRFDADQNSLTYANADFNYQIKYTRLNEK